MSRISDKRGERAALGAGIGAALGTSVGVTFVSFLGVVGMLTGYSRRGNGGS